MTQQEAVQQALTKIAEGDSPTKGIDIGSFSELPHEVQTDKDQVKLVPCRECGRPLVVTTFFAPAKAVCSACKGTSQGSKIGQPVPGQTDPAKAVDLAACLVNPGFAVAICPAHPDDEEHVMELKSVTHSQHYGPSTFMGYSGGRPVYQQVAPGESVMHQCSKCRATVAYSTMHVSEYRRQNEPREHPGGDPGRTMRALNGARPEPEVKPLKAAA